MRPRSPGPRCYAGDPVIRTGKRGLGFLTNPYGFEGPRALGSLIFQKILKYYIFHGQFSRLNS